MKDEVIVKSRVVLVKYLRSSSAIDKESTSIHADFFQVIRKSHVVPIQFDKRHFMNIIPHKFFQKRTIFKNVLERLISRKLGNIFERGEGKEL
jgi:hypothetical protein